MPDTPTTLMENKKKRGEKKSTEQTWLVYPAH